MNRIEFIKSGEEKYGSKYSYDRLPDGTFKRKDKVPIVCNEHGVFYRDYEHFIVRGQTCPLCSRRRRYTKETFREFCQTLPHTKEYTFESTDYVRSNKKVTVYCHHRDEAGDEHGPFEITPSHLITGEGCPKCRYIKSSSRLRRSLGKVLELANEVHNGKYDYSLIKDYKNSETAYPILCPKHGVFYQSFNAHINAKHGCPVCAKESSTESKTYTTEEFIERASIVHSGKYDYSKTVYTGSGNKISISCPIHGEFEQIARNHLYGAGCPKCFFDKSGVEQELFDFVVGLLPGTVVEEQNRTVLHGKEIDVYVPSLKVGFEMNGLVWHSEKFENDKNYHLGKTLMSAENGVKLIQVFEDEWLLKKDVCKGRIRSILGKSNSRVYARSCEVKELDQTTAKKFITEYHLQGWTPAKHRYGLYNGDELVAVMTFGKPRKNLGMKSEEGTFELIRFCTKSGISVVGGAGKLLNYFVTGVNPRKIVTFADRRWSNGNLYEKLRFIRVGETDPSYFYVVGKKRVNRFTMRKDVLVSKYGCPPDMTEKQFCELNGWYRIYDCGTIKYVWYKK